jgi:hypothetical protein
MAKEQYFPKISANSLESFQANEKLLRKLPQTILDQLECCQSGFRLECTFKRIFGEADIYLPKNTTQIKDFGDYIGIYSGDYFFKYIKNEGSKEILSYNMTLELLSE